MTKLSKRQKRVLAVLLGAGLLVIGGLFVLFYGRVQTLTCARAEPSQIACTQQLSWFKLIPLSAAQTIESVRSAAAEEHCYTNSETSAYECQNNGVKLITATGEVSLASDFFNTETAQAAVDRLNQFMQQSSAETVTLDNLNGATIFLGVGCVALTFMLAGAVVLIAWR